MSQPDDFMTDWFGKRWSEDAHLRDVAVAMSSMVASARADATERAAKIAEDIHIPDNVASTAKGIGRVVAAKMLAARIAHAIRDVKGCLTTDVTPPPPTKGT